MKLSHKIYIFWGVMDLLALTSYLLFPLQRGKVPFYSDINDFYVNYAQMELSGLAGSMIQFFFFVNILLIISLAFSAWSFFVKKDISIIFFIAQEIARVLSFSCSVALIPLFIHFTGITSAAAALALFIVSEALKIASVVWAKRQTTALIESFTSR
ncbi:hypothetical protein [Enterobacter sp. Bisph1]|uniref:hypothetical protein n=1 Tax=Enterobacter sp. Bisph1 TaxID=1274399 RepID=UPI00090777C5|nr:hypothetical protein [Enterobacter sp. Bisph1]